MTADPIEEERAESMHSARRTSGGSAAALAVVAALVTLGHLVGPYSHAQRLGHEDAQPAETRQERCDTAFTEGADHDHGEATCGALLANAGFDGVRVPPQVRRSITASDAAEGLAPERSGPNGRAPPKLSALQVIRV